MQGSALQMTRQITIHRATLHYQNNLILHTATSGAVPHLQELRLTIEQNGHLEAIGATRINIQYLSGILPEAIESAILEAAKTLDWSAPWTHLIPTLDAQNPTLPPAARMLFEMAATDAQARANNQPLWQYLGGTTPSTTTPTNQTLFWEDEPTMLARAAAYAARGFTQLKLRIGIAPFDQDLARFQNLRHHLGPTARLSVDANGTWTPETAPAHLQALAHLGAEYVEQPLPPQDWAATATLAQTSPIPIMLDESLATPNDIAQMASERTAPLAHLKLAKLGGLDRLTAAARHLQSANIDIMVGQMNEGAVSTLAAAHAAIALDAPLRELYGADNLHHDPAHPQPHYAQGLLHLPQGPGLAITHHTPSPLWTKTQ